MPRPAEQPRVDHPVVDRNGFATQPWIDYWLRMASSLSQDDQAVVLEELKRRIDALENGQSLNFRIIGQESISVNGVVQPGGMVIITLQGDVSAPGNTSYYGTGPTGDKGWFPIAGAITTSPTEVSRTVGSNGVVNLGLADLANTATGALLAITRDSKGRVVGTKPATITGTTNQVNVANGDAVAGLPTISLAAAVLASLESADSAVQSVVAGPGITVDNTDPRNPIVAATGGGGAVTSVNARTGAVTVPDFVVKDTAPVEADFGRPIIEGDRWFNSASGIEYSRVGGAWVYSNQAALSRYMPAYLANGSASPVPLNADGTVPAYLANGTYSPFATQA